LLDLSLVSQPHLFDLQPERHTQEHITEDLRPIRSLRGHVAGVGEARGPDDRRLSLLNARERIGDLFDLVPQVVQ
jgi:hypothetical protein